MTRAISTLTIINRRDDPAPYGRDLLRGVHRGQGVVQLPRSFATADPTARRRTTYTVLGLEDIYLSYAGSKGGEHPIHQALTEAETETKVTLEPIGSGIRVCDPNGRELARLSRAAASRWRLARMNPTDDETRVLAMVLRTKHDGDEKYRRNVKTDRWEVPILETRHRQATGKDYRQDRSAPRSRSQHVPTHAGPRGPESPPR